MDLMQNPLYANLKEELDKLRDIATAAGAETWEDRTKARSPAAVSARAAFAAKSATWATAATSSPPGSS